MLCLRSIELKTTSREQESGGEGSARTANHARATTREDGPYFAIQRVTSSSQVRKTAGIRTPELSRISLKILASSRRRRYSAN
jgi:hypothetical protein